MHHRLRLHRSRQRRSASPTKAREGKTRDFSFSHLPPPGKWRREGEEQKKRRRRERERERERASPSSSPPPTIFRPCFCTHARSQHTRGGVPSSSSSFVNSPRHHRLPLLLPPEEISESEELRVCDIAQGKRARETQTSHCTAYILQPCRSGGGGGRRSFPANDPSSFSWDTFRGGGGLLPPPPFLPLDLIYHRFRPPTPPATVSLRGLSPSLFCNNPCPGCP